nr:hypothetical protein [Tanacetum cinerariifolium]
MVGSDINGYTARFHKLARLVSHMVTPESQRVNRYIRGLAPEIKAHVTSSQPATIQGTVSMANCLTTDGIKDGIFKKKENAGNKKRRFIASFSKIAKPLTLLTQKNKKFKWGDEQENAFQTLKDMLCDALILALLEGTDDFVVYCDASNQGFGCVLMQRNKVIAYASRQLKIHEKNYTTHDLELRVVTEASKNTSTPTEMLKGLDKQLERKEDGGLYLAERIWVPVYGNLRTLIMNEAHDMRYFIHPGADKMYYDLRGLYWWPGMKKDIAMYPEIPGWKWEKITMDFINKLPRTRSGHDSIWVIVDRLTKSAHFLAIREDYKTEKLARLYINEIIARHGIPVSIISDRDSHFTSRFLEFTTESLRNTTGSEYRLPSQNRWPNYHSSIKCAPFEALYSRRCRTPIAWTQVGKGKLLGLEIVQETTDKIVQIKERLKAARDRQKSYADKLQKPLEFSVGDKVLLKVSPRKGVVRFDEVKVDDKLHFIEEPIGILDREVKKLKRRWIPIVKVR